MLKVKGIKVGDRFACKTEQEAQDQAEFLRKWGIWCSVEEITVIVTGVW